MIYLLVAFISVVMHVERVLVNAEFTKFYIPYYEIFSYWKNVLLFVCTAYVLFKLIISVASRQVKISWFWCPPILYFIHVYVSCLFSEYSSLAWNGYYNYREGGYSILCYPILMIGAMAFADYRKVFIALKVSVLLVGLGGLLHYFYGDFYGLPIVKQLILGFGSEIKFSGNTRPIYSTLMNANHVGLYCSMLLPFFLVKRQYLFVWILLFLTVACESRAAWISVFLTCIWFIPFNRKSIFFVVPLILLFHGEIFQKIVSLKTDLEFGDSSMSGRVYIWKNTLPMVFKEEMIFTGRGSSTFSLYFNQYDTEGKKRAGWKSPVMVVDRPHNMYLQMIHASGWMACFWFLFMSLLFLLIGFFIGDKRIYSIAFSVLGFLICGFFTDSMVGVSPIFWVLLGTGYKCFESINNDQSI